MPVPIILLGNRHANAELLVIEPAIVIVGYLSDFQIYDRRMTTAGMS